MAGAPSIARPGRSRGRYGELLRHLDDRLRERVADRLGAFGWRVQESVFECTFDPEALSAVTAALQRLLGETVDAEIRIYRICRDCLAAAVGSERPGTFRTKARA